ncbi:MAG: hypothetical protein ACOY9I_03765 [Pseudomonadota bacterium]
MFEKFPWVDGFDAELGGAFEIALVPGNDVGAGFDCKFENKIVVRVLKGRAPEVAEASREDASAVSRRFVSSAMFVFSWYRG